MSDDMTKVAYLTNELALTKKERDSVRAFWKAEEEEHARTLEKLNDRAAADAVWLEHMKCMQTQMERQNQALERIANIVAVPAPSATSERAARAERLLAAVEGIAVHLERLAFRHGA